MKPPALDTANCTVEDTAKTAKRLVTKALHYRVVPFLVLFDQRNTTSEPLKQPTLPMGQTTRYKPVDDRGK